jgi:hypothetical protein
VPGLREDPGRQERLDQAQHALVGDPITDPVHQGVAVDLVKARRDIGLEHPLAVAGG